MHKVDSDGVLSVQSAREIIDKCPGQCLMSLADAIARAQHEVSIELERERILDFLRGLLELKPKASLAATLDLIETTKPEG